MKKFLFLTTIIVLSTTALAFGGHGGHRHSNVPKGIDSVGVHYGPDQQADVKFECDDPNATANIYGVCECNEGYIAYEGQCIVDHCVGVQTDDCHPCDPLTGETAQATDGASCINGFGTCQDGFCCTSEGICENEEEELFCLNTDDQGVCVEWGSCLRGCSSKKLIINKPNAWGYCSESETEYELLCSATNSQGECETWEVCPKNHSSKELIVGKPNAYGFCNWDTEIATELEIYCEYTDEQGECVTWSTCPKNHSSKELVIGLSNTWGICAWDSETEIEYEYFCVQTNEFGDCMGWDYCPKNHSSKELIVGEPNANGLCNWETEIATELEVYCENTDEQGECSVRNVCPKNHSSKELIVGKPNTWGICDWEAETDVEYEYYCMETNDQGDCVTWDYCHKDHSSKEFIVGKPNSYGYCNWDGDEYEHYCTETNDQGDCMSWDFCSKDHSSKEFIVGKPNSYGYCKWDDGIEYEYYCDHTNEQGDCEGWYYCLKGHSTKELIIGKPYVTGVCEEEGIETEYELYCYETNDIGECSIWEVCHKGGSTKESIIGTPYASGICCDNGQKVENGECVSDACYGFVPTACKLTCSSAGGVATYTYAEGTDVTDVCTPSWVDKNGQCVPKYAPQGTPCSETNSVYVCNGSGTCTCPQGSEPDSEGHCSCAAGLTQLEEGLCVDANGCPPYKPVLTAAGGCGACPTFDRQFGAASADECAKCGPEYEWYEKSKRCWTPDCPTGYYKNGGDGNCVNCEGGWYVHIVNGDYSLMAGVNECLSACPNRSRMSDGYSQTSCTYNCADLGKVRDSWGSCIDCDTATDFWYRGNDCTQKCPGKNFKFSGYSDHCELVSDCAEGTHWGKCCDKDSVYIETGTKKVFGTSEEISTGRCCPKGRPVWDGTKCVPSI